jgi:hypothetical protein
VDELRKTGGVGARQMVPVIVLAQGLSRRIAEGASTEPLAGATLQNGRSALLLRDAFAFAED